MRIYLGSYRLRSHDERFFISLSNTIVDTWLPIASLGKVVVTVKTIPREECSDFVKESISPITFQRKIIVIHRSSGDVWGRIYLPSKLNRLWRALAECNGKVDIWIQPPIPTLKKTKP